jgi:spore coat protein SA
MSTVYHLLDEAEVFSERKGGAISRWAGNVLKEGSEIVICPSFDDSWGFAPDRIYRLPKWSYTDRIHPVLYRLPWALQKRAYLRVFQQLLERLKPDDVLYIHNRPECAAVLATVVARYGVHLVLHMHNSHLIRANSKQRAAMRQLPIVFCSEFLRKEFRTAWPDHAGTTHVVYNGADNRKFRVLQRERNATPVIIFTGRLVPYKGVHVLMNAMRTLQERRVQARCKIVGATGFGRKDRRTAYLRRLERIKPSNTELVGYKTGNDLAAMLQQADIFCCPSIWNDPFPLAPLEGMASGLPVVASGTGGIPEALAYGGGSLVPPNDHEALATALQQLIEDATYREELGRQALRAFQKHFLWTNVREQYESFIEDGAS